MRPIAVVLMAGWLVLALSSDDMRANESDRVDGKYALLVGCSAYPNLAERYQLEGPSNDVLLMKDMLIERFAFLEEQIVILSETPGMDDLLPTRANIQREWHALAEKAQRNDQVVVFMAGHGTQAPAMDDDDEEDGLDELFLPRDVGAWDDRVGAVENAISDNHLRDWIAAVRASGAHLCIIIDACHSGTMTRDLGDERKREITPEALGVPSAALQHAGSRDTSGSGDRSVETAQLFDRTEQTRGAGSLAAPDAPTVVALFAAQSIEPTVEKKMPLRGTDRKYYGLLTYTINEILSQAETKLTYRELVQRIHSQYVRWGRTSPTPVLEGDGMDREVLGVESFPQRAQILLSGNRISGWRINAGSLHGITPDSILAVYPAAGEAGADAPLGHVRVFNEGFQVAEARIEAVEHGGMPAPQELRTGMRCKAVYVDLGDFRLRLGVDRATDEGELVGDDQRERLLAALTSLTDEKNHLVEVVDDPADADWLLSYRSLETPQLFLTPVSGWRGQEHVELPPLFGPAPEGDEFSGWISDSLARIVRVQNLLAISGASVHASEPSKIQLQLVRYREGGDTVGEVLQFAPGGIKLYNENRIAFHVKNTGDEPLDVTLLLIDSGYGVHPLYPTGGTINRLYPGNQVVRRGAITANTTGLEHLVVIALKSKPVGLPVNFTFLSQPTLEQSRSVAGEAFGSPLGRLVRSALYGDGKTRGFASDEVDDYEIRTLTWKTMPQDRQAGNGR